MLVISNLKNARLDGVLASSGGGCRWTGTSHEERFLLIMGNKQGYSLGDDHRRESVYGSNWVGTLLKFSRL